MANEPPEILHTDKTEISCDGGEGALGHPRVYLHMDDSGQVECPYCDRLFILKQRDQEGSAQAGSAA